LYGTVFSPVYPACDIHFAGPGMFPVLLSGFRSSALRPQLSHEFAPVHLSFAEAFDLRQATVILTDLGIGSLSVPFSFDRRAFLHAHLAAGLASVLSSSAAAGLFLRCLSALFDRTLPWHWAPCGSCLSGADFVAASSLRTQRCLCPAFPLLPAIPCRFCFAPAALMGFTLRRFLLPEGIRSVTTRMNPHTVLPIVVPAAEAVGRPNRFRFLGF
jgi:hypothetical protein